MRNSDHGTTYMRVGGDNGELRPWHYLYVCSIESRLIRRVTTHTGDGRVLEDLLLILARLRQVSFRAKREQLKRINRNLPEGKGQNRALTVLCVPYPLDSMAEAVGCAYSVEFELRVNVLLLLCSVSLLLLLLRLLRLQLYHPQPRDALSTSVSV